MNEDAPAESIGDRIREIRELRGEKQPEFAAALNAAAKRLGIAARYDNTIVSKMEIARRDVGLADVLVISSLDKKRRGREWLAWGRSPEIVLLDPSKDRGLTPDEEARARTAAERRASTAARKRRKRGGADDAEES